jgi:hypothetical protein
MFIGIPGESPEGPFFFKYLFATILPNTSRMASHSYGPINPEASA